MRAFLRVPASPSSYIRSLVRSAILHSHTIECVIVVVVLQIKFPGYEFVKPFMARHSRSLVSSDFKGRQKASPAAKQTGWNTSSSLASNETRKKRSARTNERAIEGCGAG